jgi:hypothetical protein
MEDNKTNKIHYWTYLGQGIALFLIFIGMGTCSALNKGNFKINVNLNVKEETK